MEIRLTTLKDTEAIKEYRDIASKETPYVNKHPIEKNKRSY